MPRCFYHFHRRLQVGFFIHFLTPSRTSYCTLPQIHNVALLFAMLLLLCFRLHIWGDMSTTITTTTFSSYLSFTVYPILRELTPLWLITPSPAPLAEPIKRRSPNIADYERLIADELSKTKKKQEKNFYFWQLQGSMSLLDSTPKSLVCLCKETIWYYLLIGLINKDWLFIVKKNTFFSSLKGIALVPFF